MQKPPTYVISYVGRDNDFDEFINADSYRIAKHGTFTSRNSIPCYKSITLQSKKTSNILHNQILRNPLEVTKKQRKQQQESNKKDEKKEENNGDQGKT